MRSFVPPNKNKNKNKTKRRKARKKMKKDERKAQAGKRTPKKYRRKEEEEERDIQRNYILILVILLFIWEGWGREVFSQERKAKKIEKVCCFCKGWKNSEGKKRKEKAERKEQEKRKEKKGKEKETKRNEKRWCCGFKRPKGKFILCVCVCVCVCCVWVLGVKCIQQNSERKMIICLETLFSRLVSFFFPPPPIVQQVQQSWENERKVLSTRVLSQRENFLPRFRKKSLDVNNFN